MNSLGLTLHALLSAEVVIFRCSPVVNFWIARDLQAHLPAVTTI
jgi:hypothetical protein